MYTSFSWPFLESLLQLGIMKNILFVLVFALTIYPVAAEEPPSYLDSVLGEVNELFSNLNILPSAVEVDKKSFNVDYTLDFELSTFI